MENLELKSLNVSPRSTARINREIRRTKNGRKFYLGKNVKAIMNDPKIHIQVKEGFRILLDASEIVQATDNLILYRT